MIELALLMMTLNGPDGQAIEVNPNDIVSVRAPRSIAREHLPPGTRCVLQTVDGKVIYVNNSCGDVLEKAWAKD